MTSADRSSATQARSAVPSAPDVPAPDVPRRGGFVPREQRHVTILLVARLVGEGGDDLCRIRNISAGGMMVETGAPLRVDQRVRIELRNLQTVEGRVAWAAARRAGLQLDTPVGVELIETRGTRRRGALQPRAPRFSAECPVTVRAGGHVLPAVLLDLSPSGGKLRLDGSFAPGDLVTLAIPGLPARRAAVRWQHDGQVGVAFLDVIVFVDLDRWLQDRPARYAARTGATGL